MAKALVFLIVLSGLVFFIYAATADGPEWDWASHSGGWCCAKPRKWCRDATVCAQEGGSGNARYCARYEQANVCTDLCDEWRKEPGGRGGTCSPSAKPTNTCPPPSASVAAP